jgi:hypothetical protein
MGPSRLARVDEAVEVRAIEQKLPQRAVVPDGKPNGLQRASPSRGRGPCRTGAPGSAPCLSRRASEPRLGKPGAGVHRCHWRGVSRSVSPKSHWSRGPAGACAGALDGAGVAATRPQGAGERPRSPRLSRDAVVVAELRPTRRAPQLWLGLAGREHGRRQRRTWGRRGRAWLGGRPCEVLEDEYHTLSLVQLPLNLREARREPLTRHRGPRCLPAARPRARSGRAPCAQRSCARP